jgi:hypothetical protein
MSPYLTDPKPYLPTQTLNIVVMLLPCCFAHQGMSFAALENCIGQELYLCKGGPKRGRHLGQQLKTSSLPLIAALNHDLVTAQGELSLFRIFSVGRNLPACAVVAAVMSCVHFVLGVARPQVHVQGEGRLPEGRREDEQG